MAKADPDDLVVENPVIGTAGPASALMPGTDFSVRRVQVTRPEPPMGPSPWPLRISKALVALLLLAALAAGGLLVWELFT